MVTSFSFVARRVRGTGYNIDGRRRVGIQLAVEVPGAIRALAGAPIRDGITVGNANRIKKRRRSPGEPKGLAKVNYG
jgi:hypothetical protein